MYEKESEMLELFVDNDNSVPFETRVKGVIDRYFKGCGIKSDDSYIDVIRDGCRKLSHFKPEDVSHMLKWHFDRIPNYVKMHKTEYGYRITYPAIVYTISNPPDIVNDNARFDIESESIKHGVNTIRRTVLSDAIALYISLNEDKTEFIVEDSIPYNILIGNRESYINYMRNKWR